MTALSFDMEFDDTKILCAATCWSNGLINIPHLWISQDAKGFIPLQESALDAMIDQLWKAHETGVTLVTWGGTGTDWKKLSAACPHHANRIREMALAAVDLPLISAAATGMMMGLNATAVGMGIGSRPFCESENIPAMWNTNDPAKQNEIAQHVQWDAYACVSLYNKLHFSAQFGRPQLTWVTQKSGPRSVRLQRIAGDEGFHLPCVNDVLLWQQPIAKFKIPDHLSSAKMLEWLR